MTTSAVVRGPQCLLRVAALAGATVPLEEAGRTVVTTANGRFAFEGLAPATYHVRVTADRFTRPRGSRSWSSDVTNETYDNHLSVITDLAPEMGRNVKIVYGVRM